MWIEVAVVWILRHVDESEEFYIVYYCCGLISNALKESRYKHNKSP